MATKNPGSALKSRVGRVRGNTGIFRSYYERNGRKLDFISTLDNIFRPVSVCRSSWL